MRSIGSTKGQGLVGAIVAMAISIGVILVAMQMMTNQNRLILGASQKLDMSELQGLIQQAFRDVSTCSCQLNPSKNTSIASQLSINPSAPDTINMGTLRSSCNFTSITNIVAKAGQRLPNSTNHLDVASVTIEQIKSTGTPNTFQGNLMVKITGLTELAGADRVSAPVFFSVDSTQGTPTSRPISICIGDGPGIGVDHCPAGWTMVGPPKIAGTYCMENSPRAARDLVSALADCPLTKPLGRNAAQMCLRDQLGLACVLGTFSGMPGAEFFNQNFAPGAQPLVVNSGGCSDISGGGSTAPYRCCVQ